MNIRSILLKITSLVTCIIVLALVFLPAIVSASSLTDSAKKTILNTIEDIELHVDESKYPGYKEKLLALKRKNANWKFTLYYTNIDWNTAIYNETKGLHSRSLVQGKTGEWLCETCGTKVYDAGGWMCASEKAVAYLMDARNYLTESYIFQFEELSYNPDTYTIEGIEKVLNGTFMYKKSIREYYNDQEYEDITFAQAIMEAANSSGASPYYLAARIRQEIGINGSDSIYGKYKGYEGIYNFYNIGANSGEDPIGNGLKYASNTTMGKYLLPWDNPAKAIKGGAIWIATNYIAVGQDTLYFQKYDVVNNGTALYNNQYMQNTFAAKSEGYTTYLTYSRLELLDNNYNFIIPLYENMPKALSEEPKNVVINTKPNENTNNNTNTNTDTDTNINVTISTEKVKVNANNVRVRSNSTTSSKIIATLAKNTQVTRLEKKIAYKNGYYWDKVKLSNGTVGYIANQYLSVITQSNNNQSTNTTKTEIVKINENNVNVRKNATTSSKKIATLKKNTQVTRLEKKVAYKNGYYWDKVKLSNGTIGYIANKYLSAVSSNSSSSTTTNTAKINVSKVNVRKSATTSSKKIATLKKGTKVTILKKKYAYKNGYYWDKVKLSNGTIGYIATKYLS